MSATSIGWTDFTINPARGCDPVSPGCANCYAAEIAARFSGPDMAFEGLGKWKGESGRRLAVWTKEPVRLVPEAFLEALSWRKPRRVFVCSVSDLFHEDIPFEYIAAWWAVMAATPHITYQILTKRPQRMHAFFRWLQEQDHGTPARRGLQACGAYGYNLAQDEADKADISPEGPKRLARGRRWRNAAVRLYDVWMRASSVALPNVWLLTSTENQECLDERVPYLLRCPAIVHGISAEPLLGPLNLIQYLRPKQEVEERPGQPPHAVWRPALRWVIPGGESGDLARECQGEWIRGVVGQVLAAKSAGVEVALFLKQLGSRFIDRELGIIGKASKVDGEDAMYRLKSAKGEDPAEWPAMLQGLQEFPTPSLPPTSGHYLGNS